MVVGKIKAEVLSIIPDVIRDLFISYGRIKVSAKLREAIVRADGWMEYVYDIYDHGTYCPNAKGSPGPEGEELAKQLLSLEEPFRSQMLLGDFRSGIQERKE